LNDNTVADFIATNPNLTQINRLVLRAGFDGALSSDAAMFTLFAGSDVAFAAIPANLRFLLFENDEFLPHLRNLLTYNILNGESFEADFTDGQVAETFNGESVRVTLNPFAVNDITVSGADNDVSNGAVQIIDDVLTASWVPRTLLTRVQEDPTLGITNDLINLSGFGPALNQTANGNFTLLAPTDTAWIALGSDNLAFLADPVNVEFLRAVILYHILDGVFTLAELFPSRITTFFQGNFVTVSVTPRLRFNQALVVDGGRDILANNGVLQKIDSVLDFNQGVGGDTIFDFIATTPDLSIFLGALQRSGLGPALANDDGTLTVFAPTNAAFDALPPALRNLLFRNNEFIVHLQSLLLYNILPQTIASGDFVNGSNLVTANGESAGILTNPLSVNEQTVQFTDFAATNGFTNTINGVLLPSWVFITIAGRVDNDPDLSILNDFLILAGIDLSPAGALTLLAPNNAAWNALGFTRLEQLRDPANVAVLTDLLAFHVGVPIFTTNELGVGVKINTFQGGNTGFVTVTSNNPTTFNKVDNAVSPAILLVGNILAANGVVHKIDAVLDPLDSRPPV
jgi:transforming growth factor-beta-induced protein